MNKKAAGSFLVVSTIIIIVILAIFWFGYGRAVNNTNPQQQAKLMCSSNNIMFDITDMNVQDGKLYVSINNIGDSNISSFFLQAHYSVGGKTFELQGIQKSFSFDYVLDVEGNNVDKVVAYPTVLLPGLDKPYACTNSALEKKFYK